MRKYSFWRVLIAAAIMATVVVVSTPESAIADSGTDPVTAPSVCDGSEGGPDFVYDPKGEGQIWGAVNLGAGEQITVHGVHRKDVDANGNWAAKFRLYRANADGTAGTNLASTNFSVPYYWHETNGNGVVSTLEYDGPTRTYTNGSGGPEKILVYIEKLTTVSVSIDEGARTEFEFTATKANGAERSLCPTTDPFDVGVPIVGDFVSQTFRTTLVSANHPVEPEYPACIVNIDSVDEPTVCLQSESARDSYLVQVTGGGFLVWLGTHWDHSGLDSPSIAVVGTACGVDLDLADTAWLNIVSLTAAGCPAVEHSTPYTDGGPLNGVVGRTELIVGSEKQSVPNIGGSIVGLDYLVEDPTPPPPPPPPPVDPCGGMPLVECYAPEIRFHPQEEYFPMDPADFISGSELRWAGDNGCGDDLITADPTEFGMRALIYEGFEHRPRFNFAAWKSCDPISETTYRTNDYTRPFSESPANGNRARRIDGSKLATNEGFFLEWVSGDADHGSQPTDTIKPQLFVTELAAPADGVDPGDRWLVYQVFYGHDPKSVTNDGDGAFGHQGDWERIDVVLNSDNEPQRVQFHGHGCEPFKINWPGNTEPSSGPTLFDQSANAALEFSDQGSTHPVVYIAEGTHASYAETFIAVGVVGFGLGQPNSTCSSGFSGKTDGTADGGTVWQTWLGPLVDPSTQCWYQYGGAWGATGGLPGFRSDTTGPDGPPWKMDGDALSGPGSDCINLDIDFDDEAFAVSAIWGTPYTADLTAPTGTTVLAYLASVPTPLGEFTVGASGTAQIDVTIPDGTPPGTHRFILIDADTGVELFVKLISIDGPSECLAEPGPGVDDVDGDFVIDGCDTNPFDGPLADADFDLVLNNVDNCPLVPNPGQERVADRSVGVVCDIREGVNPAPTIIPADTYPLPPAVQADEGMVEAGESIEIDVLGNDIDPDADMNESSLTIIQTGSLGVATVIDDGDGGRLISYAAGTAGGVDTVGYKICNETERCATGVVSITVIASSDCTILGTSGDDNLTGTEGPDIICGRGGADVIDGLGGDDIILGGRGADIINGGGGADTVSGGRGDDIINGGVGNDLLRGNRGEDTIHGDDGEDTIRGGKHADTLFGDAGDDQMFGGRGADNIRGGDGADLIRGRQGPDVIRGNDGDDSLYGGRGADELRGGAGADTLHGRRGNDHLLGGNGNDSLFGNRGDDVLEGRGGVDTADGGVGFDSCFAETSRRCG